MDPKLPTTLLKLAIPCALTVLVLAIARRRGIARKEDLGLRWPQPRLIALWLGLWIVWAAADEVVIKLLGMEPPPHWPPYGPLVIGLRIAAIGIAGPIAEELVMRGMLFFRLARTRLGPLGAVFATAALWAAMHYRYDWKTIALIFGDGLILGLTRWRTRSIYLTMAMHILGNLYSIYQSLS